MHVATDDVILAKALVEDRIVVSADTDFGALLAAQEAERPSFILFRDANLLVADDYAKILLSALAALEPELAAGCVAVFRSGRLRVRKLPFSE
jgi:predicted nuclease of predicted toxin-antitoxin system